MALYPKYARPKVTKYQVYQFFTSTKNFHIKSVTLIPSHLFFMSRWRFTHQVYYIVISCQFFKESTYLLIKFLALISSFLYLFRIHFFPCLHNFVEGIKYICQVDSFTDKSRRPGDDPVKRVRAVWKLRALKFNMAHKFPKLKIRGVCDSLCI